MVIDETAFFLGETSVNRGNDDCPYKPYQIHQVCQWFKGRRKAHKIQNSRLTFRKL
jgi:hypothetical protein